MSTSFDVLKRAVYEGTLQALTKHDKDKAEVSREMNKVKLEYQLAIHEENLKQNFKWLSHRYA